jgi:hypothetical protein
VGDDRLTASRRIGHGPRHHLLRDAAAAESRIHLGVREDQPTAGVRPEHRESSEHVAHVDLVAAVLVVARHCGVFVDVAHAVPSVVVPNVRVARTIPPLMRRSSGGGGH